MPKTISIIPTLSLFLVINLAYFANMQHFFYLFNATTSNTFQQFLNFHQMLSLKSFQDQQHDYSHQKAYLSIKGSKQSIQIHIQLIQKQKQMKQKTQSKNNNNNLLQNNQQSQFLKQLKMEFQFEYLSLNLKDEIKIANQNITLYKQLILSLSQQKRVKLSKYFAIKVIEICEFLYGPNHIQTAETLSIIGQLFQKEDNINKAEQFYLKSLLIKCQKYGKKYFQGLIVCQDLQCLSSLNNIGLLYKNQESYIKALKLFLFCKQILEKQQQTNTIDYAVVLKNIGSVYYNLNLIKQALDYVNKAQIILISLNNTKIFQYYSLLNLKGLIQIELGQHDSSMYLKAGLDILEAYNIIVNQKGPQDIKNIQVATLLNSMGFCNLRLQNFQIAKSLIQQSLKMKQYYYGQNHTQNVNPMINLAQIMQSQENYQQALKLSQKALQIIIESNNTQHKSYKKVLNNIATYKIDLGQARQGLNEYKKLLYFHLQNNQYNTFYTAFIFQQIAFSYVYLFNDQISKFKQMDTYLGDQLKKVYCLKAKHYFRKSYQIYKKLNMLQTSYFKKFSNIAEISMKIIGPIIQIKLIENNKKIYQ